MQVFQCQDRETGCYVAAKVLSKVGKTLQVAMDNLVAIEKEVAMLGRFDHPSVLKIWLTEETTTSYFIITELAEGMTN